MTGIRAFIERHVVVSYFALTFAISWGGALLIIGRTGRIIARPEEVADLFLPAYLATVAGPTLASLVLTATVGGRAGLRDLLARLLAWRVAARWYAIALVAAPLSVIGTLFALSLFSPEFLPGFLTGNGQAMPGGLAMPFGLVVGLGLFNGFVEALGWTGFAIPRMRLRHGVFATGLAVGLLWGAWHFVSNLSLSGGTAGPLPLVVFMPALLFSFLPPFRVLMVWVYDQTDSLLIAILMHASLDIFWLLSTPPGLGAVALVTWYLAWAAVLWAVVAAIALASRRQFLRHSTTAPTGDGSLSVRHAA